MRAGVPPDTANALTKVAKPATGAKSAAGSNPAFFVTSGRMEMLWSCDRNSVNAVGRRRLQRLRRQLPARAGLVVDDDVGAQFVLEALGEEAGDGVRAAAGREADQEADGAGLGEGGEGCECGGAGQELGGEVAACDGHWAIPLCWRRQTSLLWKMP